jgi:transcriptional regulator with XRE-family HTH domain
MHLGEKTRRFREAQKPTMTQAQLADLAGVSRSLISKLEVNASLDESVQTPIETTKEIAILKAIGQYNVLSLEGIEDGLKAVRQCEAMFNVTYSDETVAKIIYTIATCNDEALGKRMLLDIIRDDAATPPPGEA